MVPRVRLEERREVRLRLGFPDFKTRLILITGSELQCTRITPLVSRCWLVWWNRARGP